MATNGSQQSTYGGGYYNAFLVMLDGLGVRQWGIYYGGAIDGGGNSCAIDAAGNIYLAGYTSSTSDIATTGSHQSVLGGQYDAFLVKFKDCAAVSVSPFSSQICRGQNAVLTASNAQSYSWSTGETNPSITVTPTVTTVYTLMANNPGCTDTKSVIVIVNGPLIAANNATICAGAIASISVNGASNYTWSTGANASSISVSPTITTNYTVTGSDASGCTDTKIANVLVDTPNLAASSATICTGSTATIIASGAYSYLWSTGDATKDLIVNPTVYTIYSLTGTSVSGCTKTMTISVSIGTAPSIAVNSQTICSGSSATLSASGVNTYSWNTGSHNFSITVNPSTTTTYTISGNLAPCPNAGKNTVTITVVSCVGIHELTNASISVSIYPNPTNDKLYIESESLPENSIVEVYNSLGQKVSVQELNNSTSSITLSNLSNGVYYLRIINNYQLIHQTKIVKQD